MGLSCSCDYEPDPGDTVYGDVLDYAPLATKRSRKCCSCGERIAVGDTCCEVLRFRIPKFDVEVNIYGEDGEIPIPPVYMCERCADLAFSLEELGYCFQPWEDQRELVADYADMHAPMPENRMEITP